MVPASAEMAEAVVEEGEVVVEAAVADQVVSNFFFAKKRIPR